MVVLQCSKLIVLKQDTKPLPGLLGRLSSLPNLLPPKSIATLPTTIYSYFTTNKILMTRKP